MPRFAANLTMLFTEYPVLERFERARAAGFEAVEFLFPYEEDVDGIEAAVSVGAPNPRKIAAYLAIHREMTLFSARDLWLCRTGSR